MPTDTFVKYVGSIETIFANTFASKISKKQIGHYLLSILPKFEFPECALFPSGYLLKPFVRMRIHYALKFGNRELRSAKKGTKNTLKLVTFKLKKIRQGNVIL